MPRIGRSDEQLAQLLHHRLQALNRGDPIAPPLVVASKFHLPGEPEARFQYGRFQTPTWEIVESKLSILDEASTLLFPSGMAAISSVLFGILKSGNQLIVPIDGYYATRSLVSQFLKPNGIKVIEYPLARMHEAPMDETTLVLVETPSNPLLDVCDLTVVIDHAHSKGALVAVDNTTATSLLQQPFDHGADIVITSDTKVASGHSDLLMGHVSTRRPDLYELLKKWRTLSGSIPGPFEAWLLHRGIESLALRLERMCTSANILAERLLEHPSVKTVRYPGLPMDPSFQIASRQMRHFGYLIGIYLNDKAHADKVMSACPYLVQATSFGSVYSSAERRARWGETVEEGFIRLSVGIEPVETLWAALKTALEDS